MKDSEERILADGELPKGDVSVGSRISMPPGVFVAIDLETADYGMDSACALGAIRVENGVVTAEEFRLMRPPRRRADNPVRDDVDLQSLRDHPAFAEVWPGLAEMLDGADYIIAHNANFDKTIIATSCRAAETPPPPSPFLCTLKGARELFGKGAYPLLELCHRFHIPLRHQNALDDAKAAMRVCSELCSQGASLSSMQLDPIAVQALIAEPPPGDGAASVETALSEFRGMSAALTCDDLLGPEEFDFLRGWLERHQRLAGSAEFSPVFDMAAKIMEDGVVAKEELEELKKLLAGEK